MQEAKEREASIRALMSEKETVSASTAQQLRAELAAAQDRVRDAEATCVRQQRQQSIELDRVEERVKAAIQRKDDTISALRAQLADAHQSLRSAEGLLADDGVAG